MTQTLTGTKAYKELQIIAAASRLFKTIGIENLTVDDLGNEMGISKKTIYHLFNGKTNQQLFRSASPEN